MVDMQKTKKQLVEELHQARERLSELDMILRSMRQTEHDLERSRALSVPIDDMAMPYQALSTEGTFITANRAWFDMTGYTAAETLGRAFTDFLKPEGVAAFRICVEKLLRQGEVHGVEFELRRKDGAYLPVSYDGKASYDDQGNCRCMNCLMHDVTEAKAREASLEESRRYFKALFEDSSVSEWEVDLSAVKQRLDDLRASGVGDIDRYLCDHPEEVVRCAGVGKINAVNRATLELYEAESVEDFAGGLGSVFTPESHDKFRHLLTAIANGTRVFDAEVTTRTLSGKPKHIMLRLRPASGCEDTLKSTHLTVVDISDRKRTEERLRASEEMFRGIVETSQDIIFRTDTEGVVTYMSPSVQQYSGLLPAKVVGKRFTGFFAPESVGKAVAVLAGVFSGKRMSTLELEVLSPAGQTDTVEISIIPISSGGRMTGAQGTARVITDRKRAQRALEVSEKAYRTLIGNIPGMVYRGLPDFTTEVIANSETLTGYRADEFAALKVNWLDLIDPEDKGDVLAGARQLVGRRMSMVQRYRITTKTGEQDGEYMGVDGVVFDITERERGEQALRDSEQLLRTVFDANPDYTYLTDLEGRIVYANHVLLESLGLSLEEASSLNILDKFKTDDPDGLGQAVERLRAGGKIEQMEITALAPEAAVGTYEISAVPIQREGVIAEILIVARDVTARKAAQEALRQSEERYRLLSETIPLVVYSSLPDENSTKIFVSGQIEGLTGYSGTEFSEDPTLYARMVHPDDSELVWRKIEEHRRNKSALDIEYRIVTRDGQTKWIVDEAVPILDSRGEIAQINGFMADITPRKRAEADLIHQVGFLQTLIDTIPNPVFYKDTEGRYTGCNQAFADFLGLPRSEIIGRSVYDIAPRELAEEYSGRDRQLLANPGMQAHEWAVRRNDGGLRKVIFNKATFENQDGSLGGLLGIMLDITDLRNTEDALRASERVYRCLFEEAPVALWEEDLSGIKVYSDDLRSRGVQDFGSYLAQHPDEVSRLVRTAKVIRANSAALRLYQCEIPDALVPLAEINAASQASTVFSDLVAALSEGHTHFVAEYEAVTCRGVARHVRLMRVAVPGHEGSLSRVLASAVDITRLKQTESDLRTAQAQLTLYSELLEQKVKERTERIQQLERQRAADERIAATGRMAARLAHEINNPLAGIKNSFLLVKRAVPEGHPRSEYVALIEKEIDRIALIIRKMFELYRDEQPVLRRIEVAGAIREILILSESSLREKEIKIVFRPPDEPLYARLPAGYLSQVMFNLLRNATEASGPGTSVTVSVEQHGSDVVIGVVDEGTGIAPEHRDLVFEPFFTTKAGDEMRGLGLGLSVSRSMVEAMGGSIGFETETGKGTKFVVRLPRRLEDADA
jgi:two-component system sporulation sensor kinase C